MPPREKKQHTLKNLGSKHTNKNLLTVKPLAGDEIQRHRINMKRGLDRAGGIVMLVTFIMDLHPSASSHMAQLWVTLQGSWVSLTNVCSRYINEFPHRHHMFMNPKYYDCQVYHLQQKNPGETIDIPIYMQGQGCLRPKIPSRGASNQGVNLPSDPQVSFHQYQWRGVSYSVGPNVT
jgi:hypothetical protein